MNGTLDRGDAHVEDAGSWEAACHHMGVFLAWAANKALVSDDHAPAVDKIAHAPTAYVINTCDCKLIGADFKPERELDVRTVYELYVPFYGQIALEDSDTPYPTTLSDDTRLAIERFLDEKLRVVGFFSK